MAARAPVSDLTDHLGYWLRFVSNHVSQAFASRVAAHGVSVAEWVLMRQLFDEHMQAAGQGNSMQHEVPINSYSRVCARSAVAAGVTIIRRISGQWRG